MRLKQIMLPAALLGLAACGSNGDGNGSVGSEGKSGGSAAEIHLQPGQWEVVHEILSMEAPGMPPGAMASMTGKKTTIRNCITPEQAARPNADFFTDKNKDSGCSYKDFAMAGGRIHGTMTCGGKDKPGTMTMVLEGQYTPQSYEMAVEMKTDAGAGSMTMKSRGAGKRIGDCPPGEAG